MISYVTGVHFQGTGIFGLAMELLAGSSLQGSREANPPMLHVPNIPVFQVQDGAPKMAKLRYKWLHYVMVYGRYNYSIHGVYKLTKINLRGGHPVPLPA